MRVGAVVLGRLGSTRLPGKVLTEVAGRPLLGWVLARLERVEGLDATVVATSEAPGDNPIARWCAANGVACFRGSLEDVAGRVVAAAEAHGLDAVARVNADSPWLDPELLSEAIARLRAGGADIVTNVFERTWPYGISAEVMTVDALRRARALSGDPAEAEHVTRPIYARPESFSILNLRYSGAAADNRGVVRLTVDTREDLRRFEQLVAALGERAERATTRELLATLRRLERSRESR
jgi:spore coat polysaccharide biosynthesis protein SpsF (cytidylyltransferase family)